MFSAYIASKIERKHLGTIMKPIYKEVSIIYMA